jgi:hypothetical protein
MMPTLPFLKPINSANAMHLLNILESLEYVQLKVILQYELLQTVTDSTFFFRSSLYVFSYYNLHFESYINLCIFYFQNLYFFVFVHA